MSKRLTKTIWYGSDVDSNGNPILPSTHGGLDGLNYGELFLHLSNGKATLWTLSSDGKIVEITGGGSEVDMSSYLLKSIWDKVFEIRTDSQGTEYIFGKLPMVTQYGITMYSGDGVNVPSLASGLPFDGRTIWYNPNTNQIEVIGGTGGGSGEGVSYFWDLSGIPSWITNSKPKYTYSEIEGTPDLSGFATQNWITSQGYASAEELKNYIPISGYTEVSGEKNFTGGLKVNGSPIYYDTEKKYWKLEGDLLVTGGVTMYGSDSSFVPSTIMDAIAVDGTTISKSGGVLKVIGGTGGGVADSVAWANITGKPTWIGSSKPTYSYSEITGAISTTELQNYLTQNSYLNATSGDNRYLLLSGGTLSSNSRSPLTLKSGSSENHSLLLFNRGSDYWGSIGFNAANSLIFKDTNGANYTIWHSGNDGSGSGLDADLLDGKHADSFMNFNANTTYVGASMGNDNLSKLASGDGHIEFWDSAGGWFNGKWGKLIAVSGFEGSLSGNASSATKLQTTRTIWGQSFDGTGNVSGALSDVTGITFKNDYYGLVIDEFGNFSFKKPYSTTAVDWSFKDSSGNKLMIVNNYGSVGIGTPNPSAKLHIVNNTNTSTGIRLDGGWSGYGFLYNAINIFLNGEQYGGIGVNTVSSAYGSTAAAGTYITNAKSGEYMNFYNEGGTFLKSSLLVNGGITMYSDQRKKTILNHVELSLKQIAEAPLIEHYYNSDDKKTTHVGSIAQYWAAMNDWFCKLDSEGYYTMEIQNAALASAISVARELVKFENETDKRIRLLEAENKELRNEIERLKRA